MHLAASRALAMSIAGIAFAACSFLNPAVGELRTPGSDAATEAGNDGGEAASSDGTAETGSTTHTVTVGPNGDHVFSPATLTISVGDDVHWVWGSSGHTVTSGAMVGTPDGAFCSPSDTGCSNNPTSSAGATYDHVFSAPGTFSYYCRIHGQDGMTGSITVQ